MLISLAVIVLAVGLQRSITASAQQAKIDAAVAARRQAVDASPWGTHTGSIPQGLDDGSDVDINLMSIGDILLYDQINDSALQADGTYDYSHVFAQTSSLLDGQDLRILNQETVMGGASRGYAMQQGENGPSFNSPTAIADAEMAAGYNVILKATNHTYDQGYDGLHNELEFWHANYPDIPVLGVADPDGDKGLPNRVDDIYIYEKDGFKVALLNYTFGTNKYVDLSTDDDYCAPLDADKMRADVKKAKEAGADMIVAFPHWGIEFDTHPSEEETTNAQTLVDAGVDVIIGGHPHILQPVEVRQNDQGHKTLIFYSMGNFICGKMPYTQGMIGGAVRVTLHKDAKGACSVTAASLAPVVVHCATGDAMTTYLLSDYTDELAASSDFTDLTPSYAQDFCSQVLGDGYDRGQSLYTVDADELA